MTKGAGVAEVFISYARSNEAPARLVVGALELVGGSALAGLKQG